MRKEADCAGLWQGGDALLGGLQAEWRCRGSVPSSSPERGDWGPDPAAACTWKETKLVDRFCNLENVKILCAAWQDALCG
eukprot:2489129-Rhodomonas_salina.1